MDRAWTADLVESSLVDAFAAILKTGAFRPAGSDAVFSLDPKQKLDLHSGRRMTEAEFVVSVFRILDGERWDLERDALICWAKNRAGVANGGITVPIFMERRGIRSRQAFDKTRCRGSAHVASSLNGFRTLGA